MDGKDFELMISSVPDREKVSCEIYYKGEILGEISQETETLLLEIYSFPISGECWKFSLKEFQEVLVNAKKHLQGGSV